jgi:hypothetical protein
MALYNVCCIQKQDHHIKNIDIKRCYMKRILLACMLLMAIAAHSQTYYWVGGTTASGFSTNSNWNTALDGSGTTRAAVAAGDILIFDGSNIGGAIPTTGTVNATVTSTTCGQIRLVNNATVALARTGGGTGTITVAGSGGDDVTVDNGCTLNIINPAVDGTVVIGISAGSTGRISGALNIANGAHRLTSQTAGGLLLTSTAVVNTNTTNYPFGTTGTTPAAVEKGVIAEAGSHVYYNGGNSPIGNNSTFTAIDFRPGSNFHIRAVAGTGSFLNARMFGNLFIENNINYITDGPVNRIENFTITSGSTFTVHTSGSTVVLGNLVADGALQLPVAASTNVLVMGGNALQTISGSGTITVSNFTVADHADVKLNKNITVNNAANIYGKLDFGTSQLTGPGTFTSRTNNTAVALTGNLTAGSYQITGVVGTIAGVTGLTVTGTGIAPNTKIVAFSGTNATLNLSQPITSAGTAVALSFSSDTAILATAHPNGLDSLNGSVVVVGNKGFQSGTSYIINGATSWPFGVTSGSTNTYINAAFVDINAPVTVNRGVTIYEHLGVNGKLTLRPLDTVHVLAGAVINGAIGSSNYIATTYNATTGVQSIVQQDNISTATMIPIGPATNYLPITITSPSPADFAVAVFEGITTNGAITGTALTAAQKLRVVDAVWNVNRITGSGNVDMAFGWTTPLEGATFTTLPSTDIGIIVNTGSSWASPTGTGNNTTNTASGNLNGSGSFAIGAVPPSVPFVFNPLPVKTYGDPDFNGGASSLNTTQPITYSSDNTAVATIVAGLIHIVGAGTANITAAQASDGFYPAASITQQLTVNKAALTITADNKTKFEQTANPTLTATYAGFVYSETPAALLTPATLGTTAVLNSPAGPYPITVTGATSNNYTITFVNGVLTVQPKTQQVLTFPAITAKTYGNANFAAGASSNNNTIPITYVSSNTNVATIVSGNQIHIVGAGTSDITASQAGNDGYFAATPITRTLTVNKANLTIRVRDTSRVEQTPNPAFTITYTGFVLGETVANLLTPPVATTTADISSSPNYYPITVTGATSNNYNITYTNGRLTVLPANNATQTMNPYQSSSNVLTVRVFSTEPQLGDIVLYDLHGRPILKKNLFMPVGFTSTDIALGTVASGIYIVTLKGPNINLTKTVRIIR